MMRPTEEDGVPHPPLPTHPTHSQIAAHYSANPPIRRRTQAATHCSASGAALASKPPGYPRPWSPPARPAAAGRRRRQRRGGRLRVVCVKWREIVCVYKTMGDSQLVARLEDRGRVCARVWGGIETRACKLCITGEEDARVWLREGLESGWGMHTMSIRVHAIRSNKNGARVREGR